VEVSASRNFKSKQMGGFFYIDTGITKEASARILDLLRKNRVISASVPKDFANLKQSLQMLHSAWSNPAESFVFYRDNPDVANKFHMADFIIQRAQNSGVCVMNAVAMLQHCLIARHNHSDIVPPILDLKEYLRMAASDKELNTF
jgi:hypothetical protein